MDVKRINFPSDGLTIEAALYLPDGDPPFPGVVVCHPHPQAGGAMSNNVVQIVAGTVLDRGIAALTFNFRGVGGSTGTYSDGNGEKQDAIGALDYLKSLDDIDENRVALAGYSFGAGVAAGVSPTYPDLRALAIVSPGGLANSAPALPSIPKLVIAGDRDSFASADSLHQAMNVMQDPKELVIVIGVDHFWASGEVELSDRIGDFFQKALSTPASAQ